MNMTASNRCKGYALLFLHVFCGGSFIWLAYFHAKNTFLPSNALWVEWLIESTFLFLAAVWSNVGWDSYKAVREHGNGFIDELADKTYLWLLLIVVGLGLFVTFTQPGWYVDPLLPICISLLVIGLLIFSIFHTERLIGQFKNGKNTPAA